VQWRTAPLEDEVTPSGHYKVVMYGDAGHKVTAGRNASGTAHTNYNVDDTSIKAHSFYIDPQSPSYETTTDTDEKTLVFEVTDESWLGAIDQIVVTENVNNNNNTQATQTSNVYGGASSSTAWNNYKSKTPSENNNDDYEDDTYWPMGGGRYGLDPQHAQVNGSFYIDNFTGFIHFSSNLNGKTVILKYISDSIGTEEEMQVHKFAEEAMYKWIMCAVLSTKANIPEYQVRRLKKEKFAAVRQAKLRLSNIKLEEITQILRGKSKQIKH
jgi:hypothetical protein